MSSQNWQIKTEVRYKRPDDPSTAWSFGNYRRDGTVDSIVTKLLIPPGFDNWSEVGKREFLLRNLGTELAQAYAISESSEPCKRRENLIKQGSIRALAEQEFHANYFGAGLVAADSIASKSLSEFTAFGREPRTGISRLVSDVHRGRSAEHSRKWFIPAMMERLMKERS